jgi:hypothetical protein
MMMNFLLQIMHAAINDGGIPLINRKTVALDHVFASRQQWSNPPSPLPLFVVLWRMVTVTVSTVTATANFGQWLWTTATFALDERMMIIIYQWGEQCGNIYELTLSYLI